MEALSAEGGGQDTPGGGALKGGGLGTRLLHNFDILILLSPGAATSPPPRV